MSNERFHSTLLINNGDMDPETSHKDVGVHVTESRIIMNGESPGKLVEGSESIIREADKEDREFTLEDFRDKRRYGRVTILMLA